MTTPKKSITKDEIKHLPLEFYTGPISILTNEAELASAMPVIKASETLGIDTETKPNFVKGKFNRVALLQLATRSHVYLFPLHRFGMPAGLKAILESKQHKKIGVATAQDMKELRRDFGVKANNLLDLNQFARKRGYKNVGVRNLAALILQIRVSKSQQMSNWESFPLSEAQARYAATDAWVCLEMYHTLLGAH